MNSTEQQYNSEAFAVHSASASTAQPEFVTFNDDQHIFNIDEDALLSSVPANASALNTSAATVIGTADDFFSSPEWTDPSPALTSSLSFNVDSCDPSPLLADVHEAPDLAGMPLFGDQLQFPFLQAQQSKNQQNILDAQNSHKDSTSAQRSPQLAFNRTKRDNEQSALLLLRAFNNQALINNVPGLDLESEMQATASPAAILSPLPLRSSTTDIAAEPSKLSRSRGTKRRIEASDLLPLNAPIQARSYKTPSSTSRKSSSSSLERLPSTPEPSTDPLTAKRLSNTLAARRSRHRKAEELQQLTDTIEDLQSQVEMWKRRCLRAEQERDEALSRA